MSSEKQVRVNVGRYLTDYMPIFASSEIQDFYNHRILPLVHKHKDDCVMNMYDHKMILDKIQLDAFNKDYISTNFGHCKGRKCHKIGYLPNKCNICLEYFCADCKNMKELYKDGWKDHKLVCKSCFALEKDKFIVGCYFTVVCTYAGSRAKCHLMGPYASLEDAVVHYQKWTTLINCTTSFRETCYDDFLKCRANIYKCTEEVFNQSGVNVSVVSCEFNCDLMKLYIRPDGKHKLKSGSLYDPELDWSEIIRLCKKDFSELYEQLFPNLVVPGLDTTGAEAVLLVHIAPSYTRIESICDTEADALLVDKGCCSDNRLIFLNTLSKNVPHEINSLALKLPEDSFICCNSLVLVENQLLASKLRRQRIIELYKSRPQLVFPDKEATRLCQQRLCDYQQKDFCLKVGKIMFNLNLVFLSSRVKESLVFFAGYQCASDSSEKVLCTKVVPKRRRVLY